MLRQTSGGTIWGLTSLSTLNFAKEDNWQAQMLVHIWANNRGLHLERSPQVHNLASLGEYCRLTTQDPKWAASIVQAAFGWSDNSAEVFRIAWEESERQWLVCSDFSPVCLLTAETSIRKRWQRLAANLNAMPLHLACPCAGATLELVERQQQWADSPSSALKQEIHELSLQRCSSQADCMMYYIHQALDSYVRGLVTVEKNSALNSTTKWRIWSFVFLDRHWIARLPARLRLALPPFTANSSATPFGRRVFRPPGYPGVAGRSVARPIHLQRQSIHRLAYPCRRP